MWVVLSGATGGVVDLCVTLFSPTVTSVTRTSGLVRCFLGPEPEVMEDITVVYVSLGSARLVIGCSLVDMDISFLSEVVSMIPLSSVVDVGVVDTDILFWSIVVSSCSASSVVVKGVVLTLLVK